MGKLNGYCLIVRDVDIEKVLIAKKIFFGEKNYKYFIDYWYNDH